MDKQEAERKFALADKLYRDGRYGQALLQLDALDRAFPNERHIMYPRALCLAKLKRREEALAVCEQIISLFQYPGAIKLKAELTREAAPPTEEQGDFTKLEMVSEASLPAEEQGDIAGLEMLDEARPPSGEPDHIPGLDTTVIKPPSPEAVATERSGISKGVLIGGVIVLCFLVVLGIILVTQGKPVPTETAEAPVVSEDGLEEAPDQAPDQAAPRSSLETALAKLMGAAAGTLLVMVLIWAMETVLALYFMLSLVEQLPYREFFKDLLHVSVVGVGVGLINGIISGCCPLFGGLIALAVGYFILWKVYGIEFTDYLYYIAFMFAFYTLNAYVIIPGLIQNMNIEEQVRDLEPALMEEFGAFPGEVEVEPPPPLAATDLTGNLLVNGGFDGLDGWREMQPELGIFELPPTISTGENHVYWYRLLGTTSGKLGVSQRMDLDVANIQSMALSLSVWVDDVPESDPNKPSVEQAVCVTLEFLDSYGNPQAWRHKFAVEGAGPTTSLVPKGEWTDFLFDLYMDPSWVDLNGTSLPRAARLTGFQVFGEGTPCRGAAGNILLQVF